MQKRVLLIFGVILVITITGSIIYNGSRGGEAVAQMPNQQVAASDEKVKQGSFIELDTVHKGSGTATVFKSGQGAVLKLENFKVTDGPDLYVYLSKNKNIEQDKKSGEFVSLGKLQKIDGDQTYTLPPNYEEFAGVSIYCQAFKTPFSVAAFK